MATAEVGVDEEIAEVGDRGITLANGNQLSFVGLANILRELGCSKETVWPKVTPAFQVDTILDQAAYLVSIADRG